MQDTPAPSPAALAALTESAAAAVELRRAYHRLVASIGALHRADTVRETGHRSLSRLLEEHLRLDPGHARRVIRHATALTTDIAPTTDPLGPVEPGQPTLSATAAAAAEGAISDDHIGVISDTLRRADAVTPPLPPAVLAETEHQLADLARTRSPRALADAATDVLRLLDPDGQPPHDTERPAEELRLHTGRDGTLTGRFRFAEPEAAATIRAAIDARTPPPEPGADTTALHPGRDLHARRGEALRALVDDAGPGTPEQTDDEHDPGSNNPGSNNPGSNNPSSNNPGWQDGLRLLPDDEPDTDTGTGAGHPPESRPPPPTPQRRRRETTVIVTVPSDVLQGRTSGLGLLDGRYALTPEAARRLACDAAIIPAVLGTRGEILDLGRKTRAVSIAQRRAVIARDRHCAHPGCRRPPSRCDVHHVIPWARDGPTDLDNLVLLCPYHHHQIHHSQWQIRMTGGRPEFIPPRWLDPDQRPRSNQDRGEAA